MEYKYFNKKWNVNVIVEENSAYIAGGNFGGITLLKTPMFKATIKDLESGEKSVITSENEWKFVDVTQKDEETRFCFKDCKGYKDITVIVSAVSKADRLCWEVEVVNTSIDYSVMDITYPTPVISADQFYYFLPRGAGYLLDSEKQKEYSYSHHYPHYCCTMQYLAAYNENGGIYIGIEDAEACTKQFNVDLKDGICSAEISFYGIGATLAQNSFKASGQGVWQYFDGDWYDAAMIYSEFVKAKTPWLPEINDSGRPDTPDRFKEVPLWIADYIPNSESQRENKPMNLSAGSDIYEKEYWYKAPMLLQEALDVPIAYHVYNWHEIPFNIEYPHFLPAKEEFTNHLGELRNHNIYVIPYINAKSWEMNDAEMGHEINFSNTGCKGAVINEDGSFKVARYPQTTISGKPSDLAFMCGSDEQWHKIIYDLSVEMEDTLDIDGIYFDEVSGSTAPACYSRNHAHIPGGGSHWVKGYNRMIEKIREKKPEENFYFSEMNAEPFMKHFDGFLTWVWVTGNEVPAFSAIYQGYIQLFGRCTVGLKKDDFEFFKYCTAQSFVCGQQIGWCKADIVYSPKHIEFLKNVVQVRYQYHELFNSAKMLRPPFVKTNVPKFKSTSGLWFNEDIEYEYVLSGAWQYRNKEKTVIFAINYAEEPADYELTFDVEDYEINGKELPEDFVLDGTKCKVSGTLGRYELKIWEI